MAMGFTKPRLNLRLLQRNNGDVEATVQQILNFKSHWKSHEDQISPETQEKLKVLEALGYEKRWKNLKLLFKYGGDVELVTVHYENKGKKHSMKGHKHSKGHHHGMCHGKSKSPINSETESKLNELKSKGFSKKWKNLKLLHKFNGDLAKVVSHYETKGDRKWKHHKCTGNTPIDAETETKLKQLEDLGFEKRWKNRRLLSKYGGSVE